MATIEEMLETTERLMSERGGATGRLIMLYSHWCVADAIRATIAMPIGDRAPLEASIGPEPSNAAEAHSRFYRILVFYALEAVVIEAYKDEQDADRSAGLDALLAGGPVDQLRRLRNAMFHVQSKPFNATLWDFLLEPQSENWLAEVHRAFESFFVEKLPIKQLLAASSVKIEP